MPTDCIPTLFEFPVVEGRQVVTDFDGGAITTDAGALLLGEAAQGSVRGSAWNGRRGQTNRAIRLTKRFAGCFTDT